MKALSFLEFWNLPYKTKVEYCKENFNITQYLHDYDLVAYYYDLVSKPFEIENCHDLLVDDDIIYIQSITVKDKEILTIEINDLTIESYPKNIDDFITLCNLANVEIIWRQQ